MTAARLVVWLWAAAIAGALLARVEPAAAADPAPAPSSAEPAWVAPTTQPARLGPDPDRVSLSGGSSFDRLTRLHVLDFRGEAFVDARFRTETQNRSGAETEERSILLQEGIKLASRGYIYQPNFIEWYAGARFGLDHQFMRINGDDFNSLGTLLGYDLSALVFKTQPVSLRLFSSRSQDFVDRTFARSIEVITMRNGLEIATKTAIPMTFLYEHVDDQQDGDLQFIDRKSDLFRFTAIDSRDRNWITRLLYEHEEVDETATFHSSTGPDTVRDLPDQRDEINISNQYQFGSDALPHRLGGSARALRRRGFFNDDELDFNQHLTLAHDPTFSTFYSGAFSYNETDTQSERLVQFDTGFRKKVFESLDILGQATVIDRVFDDGSERSYGGLLDLDYRKETPIGLYSSRLQGSTDYQHEQSATGQQEFIDEAVTLPGITFVGLSQPNVVGGSVSITDSTNTIPYFEGTDYVLRTTGQTLEIARIPTGSIADGQTVLVDYSATIGRDSKFYTHTMSWSHRIDLQVIPVALYGQYRLRDQELDSGDDPGNLNREDDWLFGIEWAYLGFSASAEHEINRQRLYPSFDTDRLRADYFTTLYFDTTLNAGAAYELLRYLDAEDFGIAAGEDFIESLGGHVHLTTKIYPNLLARLEVNYEKTRGRENNELVKVGGSLVWKLHDLEATLSGYHAIFQQGDNDGVTDFVRLQVRRFF